MDSIIMKVYFPEEIVNHIISYTGIIKERNGRYMGQIDKKDERYAVLQEITRDSSVLSLHWRFVQINKYFRISVYTHFESTEIHYLYNFDARGGEKDNGSRYNFYANRYYDYYCR